MGAISQQRSQAAPSTPCPWPTGYRQLQPPKSPSPGLPQPLPAPRLTVQGGLAADVVEELGVVGKHPPTGGTGHHLLLRVAAQVLPQFAAALEATVAVWGGTAQLRALPRDQPHSTTAASSSCFGQRGSKTPTEQGEITTAQPVWPPTQAVKTTTQMWDKLTKKKSK